MYVCFWELIIALPNGGQWALFTKVCPPWLKPLIAPLVLTWTVMYILSFSLIVQVSQVSGH